MTVGSRIVEAREAKGWKRPKLAEEAGVPYPTLAGLENGDQQTSSWIPAIAAATGVNALWLASGKGSMHEPATSVPFSQSERPDFTKMSAAVTVLREYLEILGEPAHWVADPVMLEIAYLVVDEFGAPVEASNVIDLTKRLAGKLRGEGVDERKDVLGVGKTHGAAGIGTARRHRKTAP